jgi:hypothetical protein
METELNVMDKKWKVILVPHRREKFVGELLSRLDLECYIPLIRKTKKYQRKIKFFDIPLISCSKCGGTVHAGRFQYEPCLR